MQSHAAVWWESPQEPGANRIIGFPQQPHYKAARCMMKERLALAGLGHVYSDFNVMPDMQ